MDDIDWGRIITALVLTVLIIGLICLLLWLAKYHPVILGWLLGAVFVFSLFIIIYEELDDLW